jgi:hypothetical protein
MTEPLKPRIDFDGPLEGGKGANSQIRARVGGWRRSSLHAARRAGRRRGRGGSGGGIGAAT